MNSEAVFWIFRSLIDFRFLPCLWKVATRFWTVLFIWYSSRLKSLFSSVKSTHILWFSPAFEWITLYYFWSLTEWNSRSLITRSLWSRSKMWSTYVSRESKMLKICCWMRLLFPKNLTRVHKDLWFLSFWEILLFWFFYWVI